MNQQMQIHKGPDKWLLAESLFHDVVDDDFDTKITLTFEVRTNNDNARLYLDVDSIKRLRNENGLYEIRGLGELVIPGKERKVLFKHLPTVLTFSVKTRTGTANADF